MGLYDDPDGNGESESDVSEKGCGSKASDSYADGTEENGESETEVSESEDDASEAALVREKGDVENIYIPQ